ncbi:hypothetical protein XC63_11255 [Klebsiella pneumoniae]|nr:hypothetical protein [Klebsiella pneumoniae]
MLIQKFGWWWDSLALKRPNIFANYYDALNNRIRNLRDPSLAQDAATKSYVDSGDIDLQQQITSNFKRSTINSRSISARALMTWKKKRPAGVEVSMLSVRLRK